MDVANVRLGHRQRMRNKFLSFGPKIFETYELLEMLLYHAIPYRDLNPTSKLLLSKFDSLEKIFSASVEDLVSVNGVGAHAASLLSAVKSVADLLDFEAALPSISPLLDYYAVGDYLVDVLRDEREPGVFVLLLDNSFRPIACECLYNIPFSSAGVRPSRFIDAALRHGASACVTLHTQPYGTVVATSGDRETNKAVSAGLIAAGVEHLNHYIISKNSYQGIGHIGVGCDRVNALDKYRLNKFRSVEIRRDDKTRESFGMDEMVALLGYSDPDPKSIAKILFDRYDTVDYILTATIRELCDLVGEKTAILIKLVAALISRSRTESFTFGVRHTRSEIESYLISSYIGVAVETIIMMSFDAQGRALASEIIAEGTVNSAVAAPRSFLETLSGNRAVKSVLIAHNHPFGNPTPSGDDHSFTSELYTAFQSAGIRLFGHFVVAGRKISFIDTTYVT